jgi:hypothetical protein
LFSLVRLLKGARLASIHTPGVTLKNGPDFSRSLELVRERIVRVINSISFSQPKFLILKQFF